MNLDSVGRAKAESTLLIRHPATGKIIKNDDGTEMSITLFGEYSDHYKKLLQDRTAKRIEKARETGESSMSFEDMEEENFEMACACTKGWNITDKDGPIELSIEKAREVYTEFPWVYTQVRRFLETSSNFLDPSEET